MSVQIGGLRRHEVPQFLELLRLGFEGELSPRGTDFRLRRLDV